MNIYSKIAICCLVALAAGKTAFAAPLNPISNEKGDFMLQVSTVAGTGLYGEMDGPPSSASFRSPSGLAIGKNGSLYIADTENHKIRELADNKIQTFAGPSSTVLRDEENLPLGALFNEAKDRSFFNSPTSIASGPDGSIYIADSNNNVIRKISRTGVVSTLAGNGTIGSADGKGSDATFYHPEGIAVTEDGIVYVSDTLNHTIRKISPDGTTITLTGISNRVVEAYTGRVFKSGDYKDGDINQSLFNEPSGLALDSKGNLYVSDSGNQRIRYIDFNSGKVSTAAGKSIDNGSIYDSHALYASTGYNNGPGSEAVFNFPKGIAVDRSGGLLIADSGNNVIRYLRNGVVTTFAGSQTGESGMRNGIESRALFSTPRAVAVSSNGSIYVADSGNNVIRLLSLYQLPNNINPGTSIKVFLDQKEINFDAAPEIKEGRIMVPVRQIAEALGYKVSYSRNGEMIILEQQNVTIEIFMHEKKIIRAVKDGATESHFLDVLPLMNHNRTFVPLRFFAQETGADVQWSQSNKSVILRL